MHYLRPRYSNSADWAMHYFEPFLYTFYLTNTAVYRCYYLWFYSSDMYGSTLLTCATGEKSSTGQYTTYRSSNVVAFPRAERSVIGLLFSFRRSIFGRVPSGRISSILFPDKFWSVTFNSVRPELSVSSPLRTLQLSRFLRFAKGEISTPELLSKPKVARLSSVEIGEISSRSLLFSQRTYRL